MAVYIREFRIGCFRGIREMAATELNHVNLIVGDNNCGKTSVLEALLLLQNPGDPANILRISRQRDLLMSLSRASVYENFIDLFPKDVHLHLIKMEALLSEKAVTYSLNGEQKRVLLDNDELRQDSYPFAGRKEINLPAEANAFVGKLKYKIGEDYGSQDVKLQEFSNISGMEINRDNLLDMVYLSPNDHVKNSAINNIVRNDGYKEICLRVIQLFDEDIIDLLILKNEQTNRSVEYIKHRVLGNMPISTYGNGIKKVLLLANAIAQANGGVLMIDEVETAIHAKYYRDIFQFLVKACKQYQVQLFVTTQNLEALDALLFTQNYENQATSDDIAVLTLKKGAERTHTRILPGHIVHDNRKSFDFEVRL